MYYGTQYWKDGASAGQCEMFPAPGFTYITYCTCRHRSVSSHPTHILYIVMTSEIFKWLFSDPEKFYTQKTTIDQIFIVGGILIDLISCSRCPVNCFAGVFYNGGLWGKCLLRHRGLFHSNCLGQGWATAPLYPGLNNKFMDKTDCMFNHAPLHFCVLWYLATQPRGRGEYAACKQPCPACVTHHFLHAQAHHSAQ